MAVSITRTPTLSVLPITNLPQEYAQLDQPGLYVTLANSSVGQQYLLHQSIDQHRGDLPIIVHATPINETFRAHDPKRCLQAMHRLPVATTLARLPIDLPRLFRGAQRTVFISGCADDLANWSDFLTLHGAALQRFAFQQQYCIHFLLVTTQPHVLVQQFLTTNQYLSGLAILEYSELASHYQIFFWKTATRTAGAQEFTLNTQVLPWQAQTKSLRAQASTGDRHEWLFDAQIFQGSPLTLDPSWQVFDSPEELAQAAASKREATVCFCLQAETNLEHLARLIHQVRQAAGVYLKIFVYEKSGLIRHSEVRFLWRSGANMVIPCKVTVSYLLEVAQQLASVRYEGDWLADMEDYLTRRRPPKVKGVMAIADFVEAVECTLAQTVASVLVRLPPRDKLSPAQTVANIDMLRAGDVLTITNHEVYAFLYGCHPQMVEAALNNVFNMPWQGLFRRYEVFTERNAIQQQLGTLTRVSKHAPLSLIPNALSKTSPSPKPTVVPAGNHPLSSPEPVQYAPTVQALTAKHNV